MERLRLNRREILLACALILVPPIGIVDRASGNELSLTLFYLAPISLAAWHGGYGAGLAAALLSLGSYSLANLAFPNKVELDPALERGWDLAEKVLFFIVSIVVARRLSTSLDRQRKLALSDYLTGLPNRRAFAAALSAAIAEGKPFSLSFLEVDGLDEVALERGEQYVEGLLKDMALQCRRTLPGFRYSDGRFAVLLPEQDGPTAVSKLSTLIAVLDSEALATRGLDLQFKAGIAFCEKSSGIAPRAVVRFLSDHMVLLRLRAGDRLEFFQYS